MEYLYSEELKFGQKMRSFKFHIMENESSSPYIQQQWLLNFIMSKKWRPIKHLILIIPIISTFIPDVSEGNKLNIPNYEVLVRAVYLHLGFLFIVSIILIYTNLFVLVPHLLFKNKYLLYALVTILFGVLYFLADNLHGFYVFEGFEDYVTTPRFNLKDFIDTAILPMVFLGSTTGYKVFKKWIIDTKRLSDLQKAQLEDELQHLKKQVNPHFLFNTLNNLQTLVKTDADKASQVILGLSDVLRYQIYDSTKEKVLLSKDIEMISYYLLLEKIRRTNFSYEIKIQGEINGLLIPPLLFVNFIENALKHGADIRESSFLIIEFKVSNQNKLTFIASNSKPSVVTIKQNGGVGLKNINRRLDLLFEKNYRLEFKNETNLFTVQLEIPL